ncbi:MAG: MoaD/ThiS family protein [Nanoarchaeota archaeon]|nr:MoaD/ThiS family protein [Nanoarchaeota archaeon]
MKVVIERSKKTIQVQWKRGLTVKDIAVQVGVNLVEVVAAVNDTIVTDDYVVEKDDVVEFFSVVSGG